MKPLSSREFQSRRLLTREEIEDIRRDKIRRSKEFKELIARRPDFLAELRERLGIQ